MVVLAVEGRNREMVVLAVEGCRRWWCWKWRTVVEMVVLVMEDGHRDSGVGGGGKESRDGGGGRSQMVVLAVEDSRRNGGVGGGGITDDGGTEVSLFKD